MSAVSAAEAEELVDALVAAASAQRRCHRPARRGSLPATDPNLACRTRTRPVGARVPRTVSEQERKSEMDVNKKTDGEEQQD